MLTWNGLQMKTWTDSGNKTIFRNFLNFFELYFLLNFLNVYELYFECFELHNLYVRNVAREE